MTADGGGRGPESPAGPEWYEEARVDILGALRESEPVAVLPAPPRRWQPIVLLALLVATVQLAVALPLLTPAPHPGGDNAGYLALGRALAEGEGYREVWDPAAPAHTKYPPVYPAVLGAGIEAGLRSWMAFKSLSLLFTAVAAGLVFLWARRRRGVVFAGAVALLFATCDAVLWSSRWILSDPLFVVLTFGALASFAEVEAAEEGGTESAGVAWIAAGVAAALLAYFTRSAGAPLVAALLLWLALRGRWLPALAGGAAFAVPAALWWMRARGVASTDYLSEFWMRDPYDPEAGTVGPADLLARVGDNIGFYVAEAVPQGLTGLEGSLIVAAGVVISVLAVAGWTNRLLRRPSPAELFFPLYWGLILLWPRVWSGDRLALPVLPLILFYAGEAWVDGAGKAGRRYAVAAGIVGLLVLGTASASAWRAGREATRVCRDWARSGGPWACRRTGVREFADAARWSGAHLPEGEAVFSRKPRLFYVLSGRTSRVFPLDPDPEAFFRAADGAGIDYVLVDYVDDLARQYVLPVLEERPGAFCVVRAFGEGEEPTFLFGIRPPADREEGAAPVEEEETVVLELRECGEGWTRAEPRPLPPRTSGIVPFLYDGS